MSSKIDPKTKLMVLVVILGIISSFIGFTILGSAFNTVSVYIVFIFIIFASVYFTSDTVGLLYEFYETKAPWQRFLPVFSEFYILDRKFRNVCNVTTFIGIVFITFGFMPHSIKKIFGNSFALNSAFYCFFIGFVSFLISQVTVGIGMIKTLKDIQELWEQIMKTNIGFIKYFKIFSFIPFVRIFTFYCLRKPLDTLVVFNMQSITSNNSIKIVDDEVSY